MWFICYLRKRKDGVIDVNNVVYTADSLNPHPIEKIQKWNEHYKDEYVHILISFSRIDRDDSKYIRTMDASMSIQQYFANN